jgi:cystatin-A/B
MMGAFGETKPIDNEVRLLCNLVKNDIELHLNRFVNTFEPVSYKTQVVAGINYLVQIKIADNEFIEAKIFKDLACNGGEVELAGVIFYKD